MPNIKNKQLVKDLTDRLQSNTAVFFTDYKGLSANEFNYLRADIANNQGFTEVAKNTLVKVALKESNYYQEALDAGLTGQTATIICTSDPFAMLKRLFEFSAEKEKLTIKAGIIEGQVYLTEDLETLSKLPSKEVLISQFVGGLKSPLYGIVNVFSGPHKSLVYALSAIATKKEVA